MMELSLLRALQDIRKTGGGAVYLLYGCTDVFGRRWLESELVKAVSSADSGGAVVHRHYPDDALADALSEVYTGSLFGGGDIVSLIDVECLTTTYKGKLSDEEIRAFQWLIDERPPQPVIISCKGDKLDERKKIVKALLGCSYTRVIAANKHSAEELRQVLRDQLALRPVLTRAQEDYVIEQAGSSLDRLSGEAQKVLLFVDQQSGMTDAELFALIPALVDSDVFTLVRLVVTGKIAQAYEMYQARETGESAFGLMALLSRQYRLIAQVHDRHTGALPDAKLAALCGVPPFAVKVARDQARSLTYGQCVQSLAELADLEYAIKSGQLSEHTAMTLFFLRRMRSA